MSLQAWRRRDLGVPLGKIARAIQLRLSDVEDFVLGCE